MLNKKSQEIGEKSKERKKRRKSKKRKADKTMPISIVQKLFETCKEVFPNGEAGFVPPPADIQRLRLLLDGMKPEDFNLSPDMPYFDTSDNELEAPPITYLRIYECHKFSIGIFCLPPSGVIPLHNHPGMTVFSKLLFGTMHIKSYDWVTTDDDDDDAPSITNIVDCVNRLHSSEKPELRLAKIQVDSEFTAPCETSVLFPAAGGNMHCFRALTPCAMLDVLGPPYSVPEGRDSTYYDDFPYSSASSELLPEEVKKSHAWLKEREKPESFVLLGAIYGGPAILDS